MIGMCQHHTCHVGPDAHDHCGQLGRAEYRRTRSDRCTNTRDPDGERHIGEGTTAQQQRLTQERRSKIGGKFAAGSPDRPV